MDLNVRSMDLVEAFNTFKTLDDGSKEYINTEKLVINGIRIKVSIFLLCKMSYLMEHHTLFEA